MWSAVLPVKRAGAAKTRLRGAVPGIAHRELVVAIAVDTVSAVLACPAVSGVLVVTDEPPVAAAAAALGARVLADPPGHGLNPALRHGAASLHTPVVALTADLPALRPADLAAALDDAGRHPRAYLPDAENTGTTLLAAADGALDPRFGPDSAARHTASGAVRLTGDWPSLRRDVDTPPDLAVAAALGLGPRTASLRAPRPA